MKKFSLYFSILLFSSQAFAVAVTASETALANTAEIVRDCDRTSSPSMLRQCEIRANLQAELDEANDLKEKQDLIAIGAALIGVWPQVKSYLPQRMDFAVGARNGNTTEQTSDSID